MEEKEYTISIFSENKVGLLSRIVTIFTRRHINIESLNTSESSMPGIYRFIIVVRVSEENVKKLVKQLERQVDILKAFYYDIKDIVYQEIALYKIPASVFEDSDVVERVIRSHNARILDIEKKYIVVEKTGHKHETDALLREFEKIGIYEFVRSGRVAITKPMEQLNEYLRSLETEETV